MRHMISAGLTALALSSTPALAYDYTYTEKDHRANGYESLYAGAGIGTVFGDAREKCVDIIDCFSHKAMVGYRTGEHMALEAGFHSIVDARVDGNYDDMDVSALSLSLLGISSARDWDMINDNLHYVDFIPNYQDMEVFAKLGLAAWESRVNGEQVVGGTDFLLGAGAQTKLGENLGARSEIEYFGGDVDSVNIGASLTYSTH